MFYKEKGFYASILAGVVAIAAICAVCLGMVDTKEESNLPDSMVADATNAPQATEAPAAVPETAEVAKVEPTATPEATKKPEVKETVKTQNTADKLHFNQETGLLWPVSGEVLMEYSPDKVVYFKTLQQYRTNPAILIESKVGTEVKSSAAGVVKSVSKEDETGTTVTVSIGDDFSVVYGQLKGVTVKKGDSVKEGQVIGQVASPGKYYASEGANLYYQVLQKKSTVNPLILLR
ncbi:MAG: M23 family metallopeptidase [Lachnospiraceae bacterium]|nr:M23 family metallopeptidase [Lachnospiraceae bacterium]